MIVECFGLPGAGKSTLTTTLSHALDLEEVPAYVSKWHSFRFGLRHPLFVSGWVWRLFWHARQTKTKQLFRFKLSVFITTIGRLQYAQRLLRRQPLVILDEGLLQRLLALLEVAVPTPVMRRFVVCLPNKMVALEVVSTASTRAKIGTQRGRETAAYQHAWQDVISTNFETLSAIVPDFYPVIQFARTTDTSNGERVTQALRALCNNTNTNHIL